jgi:hypothetical protein
MEMTRPERAEVVAGCREKARQCRESALRMKFPNQQKEMEETAQMWDRLAETAGGGPLEDMLVAASEGKPEVASKPEFSSNKELAPEWPPSSGAIDTDESGL